MEETLKVLKEMLKTTLSYIEERRIQAEKDMELSDGYAEASYYGGRMDEAEDILTFIKGIVHDEVVSKLDEVDVKLR